jgi:hypothetical protein
MSAQDLTRRRLFGLGALAGGSAVLASVVEGLHRMPPPPAPTAEPMLPGLIDRLERVELIMATTAEETWHIARNATPDGAQWVVTEKALHPVRADRMRALVDWLTGAAKGEAMGTDPESHVQLGVDDPYQGGSGVLLELTDGQGADLGRLVVGSRAGQTFVRLPDGAAVWAVEATPPPLRRAADWLDLTRGRVPAEAIIKVEVSPPRGAAYTLRPDPAGLGQDFALDPPHDRLTLPGVFVLGPPALALSVWRPVDVRAAREVATGAPVATHTTELASGLRVTARVWQAGDPFWLTLEASGPGADTYNARVSGFAYALNRFDGVDFATSLDELAAR